MRKQEEDDRLADDGTSRVVALVAFFVLFFAVELMLVFFRRMIQKYVETPTEISTKTVFGENQNRRSLIKSPEIPLILRVLIPIFISGNAILFLVAQTNDAVRVDLVGEVLGIAINLEGFKFLSVLSSIHELIEADGYALAVIFFVVSILWPYVKLFLVLLLSIFPASHVSTSNRGKYLLILDRLGAISFTEFHFIMILLVVFDLQALFPNNLGEFKLVVHALAGTPLFVSAVLLSIVLTNAIVLLHKKVNLDFMRSKRSAHDADKRNVHLTSWPFSFHRKNATVVAQVSSKGKLFLILLGVVSSGLLVLSLVLPLTKVKVLGVVGVLIPPSGNKNVYSLSMFSITSTVLDIYGNDKIVSFAAALFVLTTAIVPLLELVLLISLLLIPMSLNRAFVLNEAFEVLNVWSCFAVLLLAICLSVLELPTVARGLVSTLDACATVDDLANNILVPGGQISQRDADAGCLDYELDMEYGAFVALLAVMTVNFFSLLVSTMLKIFIYQRQMVGNGTQESLAAVPLPKFSERFASFGLLKLIPSADDKEVKAA